MFRSLFDHPQGALKSYNEVAIFGGVAACVCMFMLCPYALLVLPLQVVLSLYCGFAFEQSRSITNFKQSDMF